MKKTASRKHQTGMILLTSLLFLMMLTTIAVTVVNQGSRSPRMIANAEIKAITFNEAQSTLNQVTVLGMDEFEAGRCSGLRDPYNPFPPEAGLEEDDQLIHTCGTAALPPSPSIRYRSSSPNVPRSESASGVGKYHVEYYRIDAASERSGIATALAMNTYKVMLGDQGSGAASSDRNVVVGTVP